MLLESEISYHPIQPIHPLIAFEAVLYYISQHFICWDFVGMTIQDPKIVGMDPNCLHPKPRPTTPQDLFGTSLFLYQKENFGNTWWQLSQNSSQQNPNNDLDFRSQHRLDHKKSESESKVIHKCLRVITGDWIVKGNSRYWKSQKLFFCYLDISS